MINQVVICKKIITTSMSPPQMSTSNQGIPRNRQEMPQLNSLVSQESNYSLFLFKIFFNRRKLNQIRLLELLHLWLIL